MTNHPSNPQEAQSNLTHCGLNTQRPALGDMTLDSPVLSMVLRLNRGHGWEEGIAREEQGAWGYNPGEQPVIQFEGPREKFKCGTLVLNALRILRWFKAKHQTKPGGHPSARPCAAAHVTYLWSWPCLGARSQVHAQGSSGKNICLSSGTSQMSSSLAFASLNSSLTADCHNPSFENGRIINQQTS